MQRPLRHNTAAHARRRASGGRTTADARVRSRPSPGGSAAPGRWVLESPTRRQCRCWSSAGLCGSLVRGSLGRAAPCPHRRPRFSAACLGASLVPAAMLYIATVARRGLAALLWLWCEGSLRCRF